MQINWDVEEDTAGWRERNEETGEWIYYDASVDWDDRLLERPVLRIHAWTWRGSGLEQTSSLVDLDELLDRILERHRGPRVVIEALLRALPHSEADVESRYLRALNDARAPIFDPAHDPYDPERYD